MQPFSEDLESRPEERRAVRRKTASKKKPAPARPGSEARDTSGSSSSQSRSKRPAYIVGIGGSAGALEAFEQFFTHMPANSGLAFVLVTHMDPMHKGMMPEVLGRRTTMAIMQVEESMPVRPNHVCVIPPNKDMSVAWNRESERVTGYRVQDMLGKPDAFQLLSGPTTDGNLLGKHRVQARSVTCKDGTVRQVNWLTTSKDLPHPWTQFWVGLDVT